MPVQEMDRSCFLSLVLLRYPHFALQSLSAVLVRGVTLVLATLIWHAQGDSLLTSLFFHDKKTQEGLERLECIYDKTKTKDILLQTVHSFGATVCFSSVQMRQ
jgi:hypothetical protein